MKYYTLTGGYDASQLRLTGKYSYDRSGQRDLQFFTDIRELGSHARTWQGEESEYKEEWEDK